MVREQLHGKRGWQNSRKRTESRRAQVQFSFSLTFNATPVSKPFSFYSTLHSFFLFIHSLFLFSLVLSRINLTLIHRSSLYSSPLRLPDTFFRFLLFFLSPFEDKNSYLSVQSQFEIVKHFVFSIPASLSRRQPAVAVSKWVSHFCYCSKEPVEKRINWGDNSRKKSIFLLPSFLFPKSFWEWFILYPSITNLMSLRCWFHGNTESKNSNYLLKTRQLQDTLFSRLSSRHCQD